MSNAQKTTFVNMLRGMMNDTSLIQDALKGRELPCHVVAVRGQIVTVQFDMLPEGVNYPQVTIPVATFPYIRCPVQPGDRGVTLAADASLRGVSGLGTGLASRSYSFSLTPLFFVPIAHAEWESEDPQKIILCGPGGAVVKMTDGSASVDISGDKITLRVGENTLELGGGGLLHNGVNIGSTHTHSVKNVEPGEATLTSEVPQ